MNAIIAALLLVFLAASSGETNAFAEAGVSEASVAIVATHNKAKNHTYAQVRDDAQGQAMMAAIDPAEQAIKSPSVAEPFGLSVVPVATGELLTKWSSVEADIRAESKILAECRASVALCPLAARNFLAIVAEGRAHTGRARIGLINRAINLAIRYRSDLAQWGVEDRWTTPLATFTTGLGDCEDYAIAKYVALMEAGLAPEDVRLVVVRDLSVGEGHAIIAARLDDGWIILDNRRMTLVDDGEMRRVIPLFVLDRDGVKQFAPVTMPDAPRVAWAPDS
jgi:predicted transglutaminase-like cysteine proteinase